MKKYLLSLTTIALLLCEVSFTGGGMAFAATSYSLSTDHKTLTITGTGTMTNYTSSNYTNRGWNSYATTITKIIINGGVTSIGDYAFKGMTALTEVEYKTTISVTTIGNSAFYGCSAYKEITIPSTVTTIGKEAYYNCAPEKVYCLRSTPPTLTATMGGYQNGTAYYYNFASSMTSVPVYVAPSAYSSYSAATGWKNCTNFFVYGDCGVSANMRWAYSYKTNSLNIFGTGAMATYSTSSGSRAPWYDNYRTNITKVIIENGVTSIGAYAFNGLSNLISVSFGTSEDKNSTITSIAANAFNSCSKVASVYCYGGLERWLNINFAALTATPFYASTDANAPNRKLYLNGTNESNVLTDLSASTNIPAYSFYKNTGLASVTLSNTISSLGSKAFSNCPSLTTVNYNIPNVSGAFTTSANSSDSPFYQSSNINTVTIGSSVSVIPKYLFYGLSGITSIGIPSSLDSIGSSAFSGCDGLEAVYYEGDINSWSSIKFNGYTANPISIAHKLFINNEEIDNITLSNSKIEANAFYGCTSIESVTLNSTVETIGRDAFKGCTNIIKANCQSLANWCAIDFQNDQNSNPLSVSTVHNFCINNEPQTILNIPEEIHSIGNYAFYNGTCFSSISLYGSTSFGAKTFYGCVTPTIIGAVSQSFGDGFTWTLNEGVLTIEGTGNLPNYGSNGANAPWYAYRETITAVVFGDNITSVGTNSFYEYSRIQSVSWGGVTSIGENAFRACPLQKIVLSANISSIDANAFYNCTTAQYVLSESTAAPTISNTAFNGMLATTPLYVPYSGLETYNVGSTNNWNRFTNHYPYTGNCGTSGHESEVTWLFDPATSTLTISGSGAMANYSSGSSAPWNALCSLITDVVVEDGVTAIGNYAFEGCSNLENVTISNGVASIGQRAFYNCTSLETLTLPNSITAIAARLFEGCTALSSIVIPNNVIAINSYAFLGCGSLSSVSMSSVTSIGQEAFNGCASLTNITLPETLTTIGLSAFKNCGLTSITIPRNVTTITCYSGTTTYSTFEGCSSLSTIVWNARTITSGFGKITYGGTHYAVPFESIKTQITSITFGPNVEAIPNYLCHGFNTISSITIPASVTSIGNETFDGCIGITTVTSNAVDAPSISSNSFPASVKSSAPLTLVSCESKADYQAEDNWDFTTIYPNKVDFNLKEHGSAVSSQCVEESETPSVPSPAPSETGYTFGGWYDNEECTGEAFDFSSEITEDLTLYALWTIISYDVTFDLQGHGDAIDAQSINYNGLVSQPSAPSADYYTFGGWYKEAGCSNAWDFSEDKVMDDLILYAKWTRADLTLSDNADNSEALTEYDDETTNVHLTRSIISASFNTICLPFAMTAAQVETYFGAECDIEELTRASYADGDLKLFFTKRTAIEAGKPYLIKPQADVANPTIADVTIDNTARPSIFDGVTFHGIFSPTVLANSDNLLFLGASNTLYMSSGGTMKGMRGYFQLTTPQAQAAARRSARIVFHEEVATGIETVESQESKVESTKIMRDGQLLIIRDGKTYNAQGALIK